MLQNQNNSVTAGEEEMVKWIPLKKILKTRAQYLKQDSEKATRHHYDDLGSLHATRIKLFGIIKLLWVHVCYLHMCCQFLLQVARLQRKVKI